jgi:hypothetical protein
LENEGKPLKDSGQRRVFEAGAVRDVTSGKGCFQLLPPYAMFRLARHYEKGNVKYGPRNWERGVPLSSFFDSGMRHWMEVLMGFDDEDHATATMWNVAGYIETDMRIKLGLLPRTLDDMPYTYQSVQDKLRDLTKVFGDNILRA